MTKSPAFISAKQLSSLAGISAKSAWQAVSKKRWRGQDLETRAVQGRGRGGKQMEVAVSSLPKDLQKKWARENFRQSTSTEAADLQPASSTSHTRRAVSCPPVSTKQDLLPLDELQDQFDSASLQKQERAADKVRILHQVSHLSRAGVKMSDAVAVVAKEAGVSEGAIWGWKKKVRGYPESAWAPALIDGHQGRSKVCAVSDDFLKLIAFYYLSDTQPDFIQCLRSAKCAARAEDPPVMIPQCSDKTVKRHFDRMFPDEVQCYAREGEKAWEAKFWASMSRDRSMLGALEILNGDGHKLDFWVRFDDGTEGRAMATFWMDLSSNYFFQPFVEKSENMDTIRRSFLHICNTVGVPKCVDIDNGMGYAGKDLSGQDRSRRRFKKVQAEAKGVFGLLGVKTIWAEVAHGQSKPIERAFRTLEGILKTKPELRQAYVGNRPDKRPDRTIIAVPISLLRSAVREAVCEYNAQPGRKSTGIKANGRSYHQIWEAKLCESTPRQLEDWERRYCIMPGRVLRVRKQDGGIFTLHGNEYQAYELSAYLGQQIQVRFDPEDLTNVRCYTLDGQFICQPKVRTMTGFRDTSNLREYKRAKTAQKRAVKQAAKEGELIARLESIKGAPVPEAVEEVEDSTRRILREERVDRAARLEEQAEDDAEFSESISRAIHGFRNTGMITRPSRRTDAELDPVELFYK